MFFSCTFMVLPHGLGEEAFAGLAKPASLADGAQAPSK